MLPALATTAGVTVAILVGLWMISVLWRDASIVDLYWGPGFFIIALTCLAASDGGGTRALLVVGLTGLWGIRLGAHLLRRNWGEPEDRRYAAMRRHHGERFWIVSLGTVFLLQALLLWLVSLPVQWTVLSAQSFRLNWLDGMGVTLCVVGLLFEAIGDYQLARFKADPANEGSVMDRGLWRYTRHPNYFGDCVFWWGLFLFALNTPAGYMTIIGPVVMTTLLLRVSGVALLERSIGRRRPGYADYAARTSAFIPWPPRSTGEAEGR